MESIEIYGLSYSIRWDDGGTRLHTIRFQAESIEHAARAAVRHLRSLTEGCEKFWLGDEPPRKGTLLGCSIHCEILGEIHEDGFCSTLPLVPFIAYDGKGAKYLSKGRYFRGEHAHLLADAGRFEDFVEAFVADDVIPGSVGIPMSALQPSDAALADA
jgi:hypothetical protein